MTTAAEFSARLCGPISSAPVWTDETASLNRGDLHSEVDRCQRSLASAGVAAGDCVGLQIQPCVTLMALLLAVWRLDAKAMLLDYRLTETETSRLTRLCRPGFLVRCPARIAHFSSRCDPDIQRLDNPVSVPDFASLVQFTSGSTGQSKVVARSADSLDQEVDRYAATDDMPGADDRLLLLCSPVHTWGLIGGVLHGLAHNTHVLFPEPAGTAARAAQRLDATAIFGVPTHFEILASMSRSPRLPSLRSATSAGAVTDGKVSEAFHRVYSCPLGQVYGLTEVGVVTADIVGRYPPPAVGRPVPGMTVRVTGGELYIKLPDSPYLVDDGANRFADGWLRTFDRALQEDSGVISILGRSDSLIAIGGTKIDLMEIEEMLGEHPAVVRAVVTFGDVIEAHIATQAHLSSVELTQWCRGRLNPMKIPKRFFIKDQLPLTPTGKVIRDRAQLLPEDRQQG